MCKSLRNQLRREVDEMNPDGRIPRRRGGVCGLLLILLGLWGGLAPFVGPYLHFGYTPDKVWVYNSGRLYYSVIPAAAVLVGGLLVVATRNRAVGVSGGLLAALGGAWFGIGDTFTTVVLKRSIAAGHPILWAGATAGSMRAYLETMALFIGLGFLVVFLGALAMGRLSMLAAADLVGDEPEGYYPEFPAAQSASFPSATGLLPDTTANIRPPDI
jgi:hypothetical protein